MQPRTHIAWGGCFFLAWEWSIWSKGRLLLVKKVAVIMGSDSDLPVLGVLQKADTEFLRAVAGHPRVRLVTVTVENRDELRRTMTL